MMNPKELSKTVQSCEKLARQLRNLDLQKEKKEERLCAKAIEAKAKQEPSAKFAKNKDKLREKVRGKIRAKARARKETVQYQSSMDFIFAQKGMLFDLLMFGITMTFSKTIADCVPFAMTLLVHHAKVGSMEEIYARFEQLYSSVIQQGSEEWEAPNAANDTSLSKWFKKFQNSQAWTQIKRLYVYVTSLILHGPEKCRERDLRKEFERCFLSKWETSLDVVVNIIEMTKKLFTNFYQCIRSGRWSDFFHSETTYEKWYNDNLEVERRLSEYMIPNDAQELITRTQELLKQGREIISTMRSVGIDKREIHTVHSRYLKTNELLMKFIGTVTATQLRRCPFVSVVAGRSKIGKTSFVEIMTNYFGKIFNKDIEIRPYIRRPGARFWDSYQSNQWCIVFDDAVIHRPDKVMGIDPFHDDLFRVINTVAEMAECAALEDKGTKPILADLAIVTSNVENLNIHDYYVDTSAAFRRLQYRIFLELRPEFCTPEGWLDAKKVPTTTGYPDLWSISVERATTVPKRAAANGPRISEDGKFVPIDGLQKMNMFQFLRWYQKATKEHMESETKFLHSMRNMKDTLMCDVCGIPYGNHPDGLFCETKLEEPVDEVVSQTPYSSIDEMMDEWQTQRRERHPSIESEDEEFPVIDDDCDSEEPTEGSDTLLINQAGDEEERPRGRFLMSSFFDGANESLKFSNSFFFKCFLESRKMPNTAFYLAANFVWSFMRGWAFVRWLSFCISCLPTLFGLPLLLLGWAIMYPLNALKLFGKDHMFQSLLEMMFHQIMLFAAMQAGNMVDIVKHAGAIVFEKLGGTVEILTMVAVLTLGASTLYLLVKNFIPKRKVVAEKVDEAVLIPQGGLIAQMVPGNEPENVWRMHDYKCDIIDAPRPSKSLKGADTTEIVRYFHRFLVRVSIRWDTDVAGLLRVVGGTGVLIGGNKILLPTHFFDKIEGTKSVFSVTVYYSTKTNVIREARCMADGYSLEKFDDETSILHFPAMPAQRAIQTSIPDADMLNFVGPALRIGRAKDGTLIVDKIKRIHSMIVSNQPTWVSGEGTSAITEKGDCGSILLALSPQGPVLVGLHMWLQVELSTQRSLSYNLCGKQFDDLISGNDAFMGQNQEKVGKLTPLHTRSPIQYLEDLGGMMVLGSFDGFRQQPKSHVTETIGAPFLRERGFVDTHGPPVMAGRAVKFRHLKKFCAMNASVPEGRAEFAKAVMVEHVLKFQKPDWKAYMLSQKDAINGVPGVRFIDRLPMQTSCGFPYKTPKHKKLLPGVKGDWTSELEADPDIQADVDHILENWAAGRRACPVFSASLKDEPRKFSKIEEKKTRVFYPGPVSLIVCQRMIFTWFVRLVQTNPKVFGQAPGMDATGAQWDELYKWMNRGDDWIAGDYADFDLDLIIQFLRMTYVFIAELGQHLGASPEHVQMMRAAAEDLVNPLVDYFGDLVMGVGKNPSGHALTVIINGCVNMFYLIHCWIELHPDSSKAASRSEYIAIGLKFFEHVRAMTYGDDNIMNVVEARWYNHTSISNLLCSLNVTYTMADKDAESVPYIKGCEITFLKRWFRYEDEVEGYVAPLEETSIYKALMITIPSKVVSKEKAYADCINSQNEAMWHHGRDRFESFRKLLLELIDYCDLAEYFPRGLLGWDELRARWVRTRSSREITAWQEPVLIEQGLSEFECAICGRCPFQYREGIDDWSDCALCGGCTFGGDPWCVNCQEDGYHCCGKLYEPTVLYTPGSKSINILLACKDCDVLLSKNVPLTKPVAAELGVAWLP